MFCHKLSANNSIRLFRAVRPERLARVMADYMAAYVCIYICICICACMYLCIYSMRRAVTFPERKATSTCVTHVSTRNTNADIEELKAGVLSTATINIMLAININNNNYCYFTRRTTSCQSTFVFLCMFIFGLLEISKCVNFSSAFQQFVICFLYISIVFFWGAVKFFLSLLWHVTDVDPLTYRTAFP